MEDENKISIGKKIAACVADAVFGMVVAVLGLIIICNVTMIIQETLHPEKTAGFFGLIPVIVESGSMSGNQQGHVEVGDFLLAKSVDASTLTEGNVILYQDGNVTICHRIVAIGFYQDDTRYFIMKGDANNMEDADPVDEEKVLGTILLRIPKLGYFLNFLQSPIGMLLCIGVPLVVLAIWRLKTDKKSSSELTSDNIQTIGNEKSADNDQAIEKNKSTDNDQSIEKHKSADNDKSREDAIHE